MGRLGWVRWLRWVISKIWFGVAVALKLSRERYLAVGRSVCRCVRTYVGLSSALLKNAGSDPDAVWHHRSDGSRDEGLIPEPVRPMMPNGMVCGSVHHGKGYFCGRMGPLYPIGTLRRTCATVPNCRSCSLGWCVRWADALLY